MTSQIESHIEAARLALISAQAGGAPTVRLLTEELSALLTRIDQLAEFLDFLPADIEQDRA